MLGNYEEAKKYVEQALDLEKELNSSGSDKEILKEEAYTYNNIAIINRFQGNYPEALEYHLTALKIREKIGDKKGIARSYLGIGSIYNFMGKKEEALNYKFKSKKLYEEIKDTANAAIATSHIAYVYYEIGKYEDAQRFNMQSLMMCIKTGNFSGMADAYMLSGFVYEKTGEYGEAINNYDLCLGVKRALGSQDGIVESNLHLGLVNLKVSKYREAAANFEVALSLAKKIGSKEYQKKIYRGLTSLDSLKRDYASAFENYKLYVAYRDSLVNQSASEKIAKLQAKFENEKIAQIKALEEEKKEAERKEKEYKQKLVLYSISGGLFIMFVFSIVIFRSYRAKQKVNEELLVKNEIIAEQKRVVEEKQKEIIDSIRYAKRIQMSLLASEKYVHRSIEKLKGGKA
jgi:tetratricopeptide (TPR) repeat protein